MITKLFNRIRWKLLLFFFLSIFLAAVTTVGLLFIAVALASVESLPVGALLNFVDALFGPPVAMLICGFVLFIAYFFLLTHGTVRYLSEITRAVQQIAGGRFDVRIPVRSGDELSELAANINSMAQQLKTSIEEERRAERTKSELITSVSHDLRTPLTSISGYLGLIEQDRYRDEVELRCYVQIAYEKTQRLSVLINDLFEYARASGGAMRLEPTAINLVDMLAELAVQMRPQLEEAGMECRLRFPEEKLVLPADGNKLVRVFENLFINAIAYGREGKFVDCYVYRDGPAAVVDVVNYGEPIPEGDLPRVFDRFYRVEKSRAEYTGGSGLGLAIAKTIVELHGGSIAASSNPSRTVFQVRLPIAAENG